MQTTIPPQIQPASRRGWALFKALLLLSPIALTAMIAWGIWGFVTVSADTRAMRDAVVRHCPATAHKKIDLSFGMLSFGLVSFGSQFVEMPPEARIALSAARGVEVSVYHLDRGGVTDRTEILAEADLAMEKRGWDRTLGVVRENELVAVYLPRKKLSTHDANVAVLVLNHRDLVCVSARANLQPLVDLAMEKMREKNFMAGR